MKNAKLKISAFLSFLILIYSIQPVLAANQYSVNPGAQFRWDASKYYFLEDGLGPGNDLEYTHYYYLEFNFSNWGIIPDLYYLNGTVDNNGTVSGDEITHEHYYTRTLSQKWVTEIIDIPGPYPVEVYLVCDIEIDQETKPQLQNLAANIPGFTFSESSANNFSLIGTYIDGLNTLTYTGNIEFNSDKVLKYVFDEFASSGDIVRIERYIWTLTSYTPGTGTGDDTSIPGFQLIFIIGAMTVGFIFILKKYKLSKTR